MTATLKNKRTIADIEAIGNEITLRGEVVMNSAGQVDDIKGQITLLNDSSKYVGSFSALGVNVQEMQQNKYLAPASAMLAELITSINDKTIIEA